MKHLKNTALAIGGLVAWMTIGISGQMMQRDTPAVRADYVYAVLLILSVVYLHWALRTYLTPIRQLPETQIRELRQATYARYVKGFLAGTVGAGYFLLALHVFAFLDRSVSHEPGFLSLALFLIALGTFAQARALVEHLCKNLMKNEGKENRTTGSSVP